MLVDTIGIIDEWIEVAFDRAAPGLVKLAVAAGKLHARRAGHAAGCAVEGRRGHRAGVDARCDARPNPRTHRDRHYIAKPWPTTNCAANDHLHALRHAFCNPELHGDGVPNSHRDPNTGADP